MADRTHSIGFAIVLLGLSTLGWNGCVANTAPSPFISLSQSEQADVARDRRIQSASLAQMAERRELEADLLAKRLGEQDPAVRRKRELADELRAAAQETENQAQTLRQGVPHGMVQ
jgi:hypothetical protein